MILDHVRIPCNTCRLPKKHVLGLTTFHAIPPSVGKSLPLSKTLSFEEEGSSVGKSGEGFVLVLIGTMVEEVAPGVDSSSRLGRARLLPMLASVMTEKLVFTECGWPGWYEK